MGVNLNYATLSWCNIVSGNQLPARMFFISCPNFDRTMSWYEFGLLTLWPLRAGFTVSSTR